MTDVVEVRPAYRDQLDAQANQALDAMAADAKDLGLYG